MNNILLLLLLNLLNKKKNNKLCNKQIYDENILKLRNKKDKKEIYPNSNMWTDSIYCYNTMYYKLLFYRNTITRYLFETYINFDFFNLKNKKKKLYKLKNKKKKNKIRKRSSVKKTFISKPNIKHTNNKAIITLFLYDKKQQFIIYKIIKFIKKLKSFLKKKVFRIKNRNRFQNSLRNNRLKKNKKTFQKKNNGFQKRKKNFKQRINYYSTARKTETKSELLKSYLYKIRHLYKLYKFIKHIKNFDNIKFLSNKLYNNIKHLKKQFSKYKNLKKKMLMLKKKGKGYKGYTIRNKTYKIQHSKILRLYEKKISYIVKLLSKKEKNLKLYLKIVYLYKLYISFKSNYNFNKLKFFNFKYSRELHNFTLNNEILYIAWLFNFFFKKTLIFKRIKKILYYNQILLIQIKKKNNIFFNIKAIGLTNLLKKIYTKQVEIDIINHKSIYLNSDILSNSISFKLKDRKKKILKIFNLILRKMKFPKKYSFKTYWKKKDLKSNVIKSLNNKVISGIRLKGSGRLTRRLTALRSISKIKHKGTLKNINSSYKQLSSPISIGYMRSNLQYSKIDGKTRNGSFGLKCWVSSF